MKSNFYSFGFITFLIGIALSSAVHVAINWETPFDMEERRNEILAMSAGDVVDTFVPELRPRLEQLSEETADELVRAILGELRGTFEDISKESYLRGYTDGSQGIGGNISAPD